MSREAVNWVYQLAENLPVSAFPKGPVDVLAVLANFADQSGRCWCRLETLMARTRYGRRAVIGHLTWSVEHGLLDRRQRWEISPLDGRPHKVSEVDYWLHLEMPQPNESPSQLNGDSFASLETTADGSSVDNLDAESVSPCGANSADFALLGKTTDGPPVDNFEPDSVSPSRPNNADFALLGEVVPNSASGPRLMVQPDALLTKDKQEEQEPGPTGPVRADAREGGSGRAGAGEETGEPGVAATRDDFELVRRVLPAAWAERLDAEMTGLVARVARPRLAAGWSVSEIRAKVGGSPLPPHVHSLGHLLAKRIEAIPLDCAPEPEVPPAVLESPEPVVSEPAPPWAKDLEAARDRGDPRVSWRHKADWVSVWVKAHPDRVKAWRAAHPGHELHVPARPNIQEEPARPAGPPAEQATVSPGLVPVPGLAAVGQVAGAMIQTGMAA